LFVVVEVVVVMMRLQIRSATARVVVSSLSTQSSIADLLTVIEKEVKVPRAEQRLMLGFPPKELDLSNKAQALSEAGIKSGDSIMVETSSSTRGIVKASAEESAGVIYSIPKNRGYFSLYIDNRSIFPVISSFFSISMAYICIKLLSGLFTLLFLLLISKAISI
jgi:hypothetical protein